MRPLPLEFGRASIALANACGVNLRYEVRHIFRGCWELTIDADGLRRTRQFARERGAKSFARNDFRRRQLLRLTPVIQASGRT